MESVKNEIAEIRRRIGFCNISEGNQQLIGLINRQTPLSSLQNLAIQLQADIKRNERARIGNYLPAEELERETKSIEFRFLSLLTQIEEMLEYGFGMEDMPPKVEPISEKENSLDEGKKVNSKKMSESTEGKSGGTNNTVIGDKNIIQTYKNVFGDVKNNFNK